MGANDGEEDGEEDGKLKFSVSIITETQWRQRIACDLCGAEDVHLSEWEQERASGYPAGWAHFCGLKITQVNSPDRAGKELDFCPACIESSGLRAVIDRVPYDEAQNVGALRARAGWH